MLARSRGQPSRHYWPSISRPSAMRWSHAPRQPGDTARAQRRTSRSSARPRDQDSKTSTDLREHASRCPCCSASPWRDRKQACAPTVPPTRRLTPAPRRLSVAVRSPARRQCDSVSASAGAPAPHRNASSSRQERGRSPRSRGNCEGRLEIGARHSNCGTRQLGGDEAAPVRSARCPSRGPAAVQCAHIREIHYCASPSTCSSDRVAAREASARPPCLRAWMSRRRAARGHTRARPER